MADGDGDLRYDVLAHETANGRHGKVKKLTVNRFEQSAAFGEAPKGRVFDDGDWREKERAGKVKSGEKEAKT